MKFGRTYEIQITTPGNQQIIIRPPFTVQFSITRNTLASANGCTLSIINLGRNTRNKIYKDRYAIAEYWQLIIRAGYTKLETIFQGNILEASSTKQGTDWVTKISGFDGMHGIQNGFTSQTVSAGTDQRNILQDIIGDMPNVIAGIIGSPGDGQTERGKVLFGQSKDVLSEETGGQYWIDSETVNVLSNEEVIARRIITVDSDQLLATPQRRDTFLDCEILFLPSIQVGQLMSLSSTDKIYNGQYKVLGFTHNVTISQSISGDARTKFSLYAGAAGLQEVS